MNGYDFIPIDGSERILITDIGTSNTDSLVCQSSEATTTHTADWYYNPTSLSLDPSERITVPDELERGWFRNRNIESQLVRLFRDEDTANALEGVFTCEVAEDPASPISVGIYYASELASVRANIFMECSYYFHTRSAITNLVKQCRDLVTLKCMLF